MSPLISIIITSYNRQNYIPKAIESALKQDYQNIEIIIIDNCSTDNSEEVINRYKDKKIRYIKNEINIGAVPSIIKAIGLARGEYVTHLSSDDCLIYDSFISEGVELIRKYANVSVVTAKNIFFNEKSRRYHSPSSYKKDNFFKKQFVSGNEVFLEYVRSYPITMGACIMNREKFIELENESNAPIYYDLQIIMQLLLLGNAAFLDKEAYLVNLHDKNLSSALQPASVNIHNYVYIQAPYELARSLGSFDTEVLHNWYNIMLLNYSLYVMGDYYKKDKKQFEIFSDYVKHEFPSIYEEISLMPKWRLLKALFKYPFVGANLAKIRNLIK